MKENARKKTYTKYDKENAERINSKKRARDRKKAEKKMAILEDMKKQIKVANDKEMPGSNHDLKFTLTFNEIKLGKINPGGCYTGSTNIKCAK